MLTQHGVKIAPSTYYDALGRGPSFRQVSDERWKPIEAVRRVVREELDRSQADAIFTLSEAKRRYQGVKKEQEALLKAHYAGAVPLDLLKSEMDRTTRELDAATAQIRTTEQTLDQLDEQLDRALEVVRLCGEQYSRAVPSERRMLNQGLFVKLFIGQDGTFVEVELQDLFAGILSRDTTVKVENPERAVIPVPTQVDEDSGARSGAGILVPVSEWGSRPERRWSPSAVLLSVTDADETSYARTPPRLSFGRGSNNAHVAEGVGFSPPPPPHVASRRAEPPAAWAQLRSNPLSSS